LPLGLRQWGRAWKKEYAFRDCCYKSEADPLFLPSLNRFPEAQVSGYELWGFPSWGWPAVKTSFPDPQRPRTKYSRVLALPLLARRLESSAYSPCTSVSLFGSAVLRIGVGR
jgi:hypothetical protein